MPLPCLRINDDLHAGARHIRRIVSITRVTDQARRSRAAIAGVKPLAEQGCGPIGVCLADPAGVIANYASGRHHETNEGAGGFFGEALRIFITSRGDSLRPISSGGTRSTCVTVDMAPG
jgi:hypothetical protein